MTEATD
jgi:hypothetical protein